MKLQIRTTTEVQHRKKKSKEEEHGYLDVLDKTKVEDTYLAPPLTLMLESLPE